jgi:MSHA biogenesis protein MshI
MKIPFLCKIFRKATGETGRVVACFRGNAVTFVRLVNEGDKPKVEKYAVMQMADRNSAALAKCAAELSLTGYQFSTLLLSHEYQLLSVDAPNVPDEELKSAIRWRVKDTLGYPADEAMLDVLKIPNSNVGIVQAKSLYVVAAKNSLIKQKISLFENAKLDINTIDIPEMAQRNVAALFEKEGRGLAFLAFDETGGLLTFTGGGELYLARRIEISIGQLQDADEHLRQQSYDRLELELQRSMDSFDRNFNHLAISHLVVAVHSDMGLIEKLRENLYVPVEGLNLSAVMDFRAASELISEEAQLDAFYALGAALRQESSAA